MTVRVSSKYQVVIPLAVRKALGIKPGTKVEVFQYENRIELVPHRTAKEMRGILRGINTSVPRDRDRV